MDFIVEKLNNTNYSVFDVFQLLQKSFEERLEQGLHFTCSSMSFEEFSQRLDNAYFLVALSGTGNYHELIGTAIYHIYDGNNKKKYGYLEYIAAHPNYKHLGVCTSLFSHAEEILRNAGCVHICSDTAVGAHSSINWHKKQGFKTVGLASFPTTNYYSFLFKKRFHESFCDNLYNISAFCLSSLRTLTTRNRAGQYTFIGKWNHNIRTYICKNLH